MTIQTDSYVISQDSNENSINQNNIPLLKQPNLNINKNNESRILEPQNKLLIGGFHKIKDKTNKDYKKFEYNGELTNEKLQTRFKSKNGNNNEINKTNSNIIKNSKYKKINSPNAFTTLKVNTQDNINFNTSKNSSKKPKIIFNFEKKMNDNYKKNASLFFHKKKIVVMKIIRSKTEKGHLRNPSNESQFNFTHNSIKDNKHLLSNEQKKIKVNVKLNNNSKSRRLLYFPFNFNLKSNIDKYKKNINILPIKAINNFTYKKKNNNINDY
jgi:hypothetical protein